MKEEIFKKNETEKSLQEELEAARNEIEKLKAREFEHKRLEVKLQSITREKEIIQQSTNELTKELQCNLR